MRAGRAHDLVTDGHGRAGRGFTADSREELIDVVDDADGLLHGSIRQFGE